MNRYLQLGFAVVLLLPCLVLAQAESSLCFDGACLEGDQESLLALLDSPGDGQEAAISELFTKQDWYASEPLRTRLSAMLRDSAVPGDLRISILWMFRGENHFADVRSDALALARDANDFDLARGASLVYVLYLLEDKHRIGAVRRLARSDDPVLAEMAAECLLSGGRERRDSRLFPELVEQVARLAESQEAPPEARGEAIGALVSHDEEPAVVPVLLRLLSPEGWFFGAAGQHFPVHSLGKLIVPLSNSRNDQIQKALRALPDLVHQIPEEEGRDYVEWEIRTWITKQPGS